MTTFCGQVNAVKRKQTKTQMHQCVHNTIQNISVACPLLCYTCVVASTNPTIEAAGNNTTYTHYINTADDTRLSHVSSWAANSHASIGT